MITDMMVCQGQAVHAGHLYCNKCFRLHKACVGSISKSLMGKNVTFSLLEGHPLCQVMHVTHDRLLANTELHWRMTSARLHRTMMCNNVACGHIPTLEGGATVIHFDFCHRTAQFKGWLCSNCNRALGGLADDGATITRARHALRIAAMRPDQRPHLEIAM